MPDATSIVIIVSAVIMLAILAVAGFRYLLPMFRSIVQSSEPSSMAKLLVTAIKLENAEILREAKKEQRIYAALKDEILRAREMYMDRASSQGHVSEEMSERYFEQALVDILADGDRSALGLNESLDEKPLS